MFKYLIRILSIALSLIITEEILIANPTLAQENNLVSNSEAKDINNQSKSLNSTAIKYYDLGKWQQAETIINQSIELLKSQPNLTKNSIFLLQQAYNIQGNINFSTGKIKEALSSWQKAEKQGKKIEDFEGIQYSLINQVTAYSALGEYLQANKILKKLEVEISQQPDSKIKVYSLLSLGNSLNKQGNLEDSELILQKSLSLGENFFTREEMGELWFAFANTLKDLNNNDEALTYYQKIINNTADNDLKSKALVNQLLVFITQEYWQNAHNLVPVIEEEISLLKPSRSNIYTKINFSQNLLTLSAKTDNNYSEKIINILTESLTQVEKIEDQNSQSYIYGMLGKLYLQHQRIGEAKQLTEKALILARTINANDISVQWEAQMGKIYQQEGDRKQAIYFYKNAINNLENLNKELYSNREVQFSFKESIEPIYRSLIDLLLVDKKPSQNNLKESIEIFEQLQVAELKNFFGDGCVVSKSVAEINNQETVIIYPIILPKRLVVITSLSGEKFEYSSVDISELELEGKIIKTRNALHPFISNQKRQQFTQQLYNLLIQPFEQKLISNNITTLVFTLDGGLRNLPMGTLFDGENYLIEKYAISLLPLRVELLEPKELQEQKLDVLLGGLSESRQGFSSLPAVEIETQEIATKVPSEILLNENFTEDNLQALIKRVPFPVVHLATHGQFSSKEEETFLLAWDGKINIRELELLIKSRKSDEAIELLVLSACETASGDNRAALGLAGLAMRSGARSVVATLWSVNDESTAELMVNFYEELQKPNITKSQALREAQIKLLRSSKYNHPYYWGAFVMLGNWL